MVSNSHRGDLGATEPLDETNNELPLLNGRSDYNPYNEGFHDTTTTLTSHPNRPDYYQTLHYHQHSPNSPLNYYNNNYRSNERSKLTYENYNNKNYISKERRSKEVQREPTNSERPISSQQVTSREVARKANQDSQASSDRSSTGYYQQSSSGLSAAALLQQLLPHYRGQGTSALALAHAHASGGRGGSSTALAHAQGNDITQALAHARVYSTG